MLKIICAIIIIEYFLFWWSYIPKDVDSYKKRGKIILNEDMYIKTLRKTVILDSILYSICVIVVVYILKNLSITQIILILTGYRVVKMIIYYKIAKKYMRKKL